MVRHRRSYRIDEILKRLQKFREIHTLGKLVSEDKETAYTPSIDSENNFTYNKWTLLKLLFLFLYTPLYTSIIGSRYADMNYIDLFSGSGVNKLEDTDIVIAGSPIIALALARIPFNHAYFNDTDGRKICMLKKRVEKLKELSTKNRYREVIFSNISSTSVNYRTKDANEALVEIFEEIDERARRLLKEKGKGCHNLIFIDPFGFEFKRESLELILKAKFRSDIIILFNSYGAGLNAYNIIKLGRSSKSLDNLLGTEWLDYVKQKAQEKGKSLEDLGRNELSNMLSEYYVELFRSHNYVVRIVRLPLRLESQQFDLIFACRRTNQGNRFLPAVDYIKNMLEKTDYRLVDELEYSIKTGRLPGLIGYIIEDPETALEKYKTARRYGILKYQYPQKSRKH